MDLPIYESTLPDLPLSGAAVAGLLEGVLARGRPFRFRAGGGSMFPFIRDGDVLTILPLPAGGPRPGDVVAFRQTPSAGSGRLVVHRVVARAAGGCILKGDAYPRSQSDGLIPPAGLLGFVARVERRGRPARLGLGPERRLIALLSRLNLLHPATHLAAALYRILRKSSP